MKVQRFGHPQSGLEGKKGGRGYIIFILNTITVNNYSLINTLDGNFPWLLRPGCDGDHEGLPPKYECPPVGGHNSTHELSVAGCRGHGCDGGYGWMFTKWLVRPNGLTVWSNRTPRHLSTRLGLSLSAGSAASNGYRGMGSLQTSDSPSVRDSEASLGIALPQAEALG